MCRKLRTGSSQMLRDGRADCVKVERPTLGTKKGRVTIEAQHTGRIKGQDGPTNLHFSWCHVKGHLARNCREREAGDPRKPGRTRRPVISVEQGPVQ